MYVLVFDESISPSRLVTAIHEKLLLPVGQKDNNNNSNNNNDNNDCKNIHTSSKYAIYLINEFPLNRKSAEYLTPWDQYWKTFFGILMAPH